MYFTGERIEDDKWEETKKKKSESKMFVNSALNTFIQIHTYNTSDEAKKQIQYMVVATCASSSSEKKEIIKLVSS